MKNIEFTTSIEATAEKVWKALWEKENYLQWSKVFNPTSRLDHYDFTEGEIVQFLGEDNNGMYALVEVNKPPFQMTLKYLGEISEGEEIPFTMHQTKELDGSESYFLIANELGTDLNIEVVVPDDFAPFMEDKFPQALQKIKAIAEG